MPPLRQCLSRPETYLAALAILAAASAADSFRPPRRQATGAVYVRSVRGYQALLRPALSNYIACRYLPTCSDYSIQAVERHGIRNGLSLTWRRVNSCRRSVPLRTPDPVPAKP